jgi:hypothetical protein
MPTTPNRSWVYPSFEQNPYFETIEDFFLAQDADMHATITGVRTVATGGTGASTLASGAYLKGAGTSAITTQATPIPVADGGTGRATRRLVAALVASSSVISNTTSTTTFNKNVNLPAGILNVAGAVLTVRFRLSGSSNIAAPGNIILDPLTGPSLNIHVGIGQVDLPPNATSYEASLMAMLQVRTTGSAGTVITGLGFMGIGLAPAEATSALAPGAQTIDLTQNMAIILNVQFSVANAAVSAQLDALTAEVDYPDTAQT